MIERTLVQELREHSANAELNRNMLTAALTAQAADKIEELSADTTTDPDQLISRLLSLSHHAKKLSDGILCNDHPHSLGSLYRDTIERAGDESEAAARCIKQLLKQVEDLKKGFEGCCYACEPVGLLNKQLLKERDEARREVCRLMSMFNAENSVEIAASRSWDCFKEGTQ